MSEELAIVDRTYSLILWTHSHVAKFPKHSRFSLGTRLEDRVLTLLENLLDAKFSKIKVDELKRASLALEQYRFLLRLCKDTHLIAIGSHDFAVGQIVEISKQLQAWRRHSETRL